MTTNNHDNPAAYRRVAILRPGEYIADDGQPVSFSAEDLARLAENYDPHYHCAPVNIDHAEHGPALGLVGDLVFDGEYLAADLIQVPAAVADALDAGRYPGRSAEIYSDLDGRRPYLRAVALLGARPPAVKGLPPLPPRANSTETKPTNQGRALSTRQAGPAPRRMPHVIHVFSEVRMRNPDGDTGGAEPAPAHDDPAAKLTRLAEDNRRLADENRRLKLAERRREAAVFVASLREAGRLTPAMEQAGLEEALAASQDHPSELELADGRQAPLSEVLKEIFSALPACCPLDEALDDDGSEPEFELSATEKSVAEQLGLSEREYAEIAQG